MKLRGKPLELLRDSPCPIRACPTPTPGPEPTLHPETCELQQSGINRLTLVGASLPSFDGKQQESIMAAQKVCIWVEEEVTECMIHIHNDEDLVSHIAQALRYSRNKLGIIVSREDSTWNGYRRITVHVSPPMCQRPECNETLVDGEETECDWHREEDEE